MERALFFQIFVTIAQIFLTEPCVVECRNSQRIHILVKVMFLCISGTADFIISQHIIILFVMCAYYL